MKRRVKIRQHDRYDCGAACLCSVLAWHGLYIPLNRARRLCGCTKDGITIKGIIDGAGKYGIDAEAFKSTDKDLCTLAQSVELPAIAHLRREDGFYHFVVVVKTDNKYVEIMDPSSGELKRVPNSTFIEEWTGYIINLVPGSGFRTGNERINVYRRLFSLLISTKREIVHAFAGATALIAGGIVTPLFLQHIIDDTIPSANMEELAEVCGIVISISLLMLFISYSKNIYFAAHGMRIDNNLIINYIKKIFKLPADSLCQYSAGDLNTRISDAFNIRLFISEGVVSVLISAITLTVSVIIIFNLNNSLAVLSISFIPMYAGLYFLSGRINKRYNRELALSSARFETDMLQGMDSIACVRHYGAENLSLRRIQNSYGILANKIFDTSKAVSLLGTFSDTLSKSLVVATLTLGGFMVFADSLTVGELVAFYTLCAFYTAPLSNITKMNSVIEQAVVSAERLFEIMDIEEEHDTESEAPLIAERWRDISFDKIGFGYPGREMLFEHFSLRIERGDFIAIAGNSGCGKSTLVSLLMRDYDLHEGAISIDGTSIRNIPRREWLSFITLVPQKVHLFNATILENITCGQENPNIERVIGICSEIGLGSLIQKLPTGLFTHIGDEGGALSGGERQKLAIARAVYKDPQIFIFDESTSSVDKSSESFIMQYIEKLNKRGKTIILISHNMEVIKYANKIVQI